MSSASFITLQLARFDAIRANGGIAPGDFPGLVFAGVAADTRAAGTEPASQQAFVFAAYGYHADRASADRWIDSRKELLPWFAGARESWAGILQPFRQRGVSNHPDRAQPGLPFAESALVAPPPEGTPLAVVTTTGWTVTPELDLNRVREFSTGVMAVRMAMTGNPALHSQQSFFFPRALEYDPSTVTFWSSLKAMTDFAYGPGIHSHQMGKQADQHLADRISSCRCLFVRSEGTWYGSDPSRPRPS